MKRKIADNLYRWLQVDCCIMKWVQIFNAIRSLEDYSPFH